MQITIDTSSQEEIRKAIKMLQALLDDSFTPMQGSNDNQEPEKKEPNYDMSQMMTY